MKSELGGESNAATVDFWALWLRHRNYLYKRCVRWLGGNRNDAEDVLSKGAVNAALYIRNNPAGVLQFRPWILRVLHNLCIDDMRARSRGGADPGAVSIERTATIGGWSQCPDQGVLRGEIGGEIERAANDLPSHLRHIFLLRFVDEQPYEQIARTLEISPENARKRLQQARGLMRVALRSLA